MSIYRVIPLTMLAIAFAVGASAAQTYSPYPTQPPPGYRAVPGGYQPNGALQPWDDDADIDPAPRQHPRGGVISQRPLPPPGARDGRDASLDDEDIGAGAPMTLAPRPGTRVASLPADADPAYSTRVDYDSEVDETQSVKRLVADPTGQPAGVITINTGARKLYLSLGNGQAIEYGVGVGREGFLWKGSARIGRKAFWPGWTPPSDMLLRRPDLPRHMEGGLDNPLGARALYLFQGNKDTLFRIHGTNEPDTIGHAVSSGCIRMNNADVMDLYQRVQKGAKVVVI